MKRENRLLLGQLNKLIIFIAIFEYVGIAAYLSKIYEKFLDMCVNRSFLSWDVNIRYVITLDMMDSFRNHRYHEYIIKFFDAPTWPAFRNVIETIVFSFTGPDQNILILITFVIFSIIPLCSLYILKRETKNSQYLLPFVFLIFWTILLQCPPAILYSLTGMLETQGSLFFMLALYFISRVYSEPGFIARKSSIWKVVISSFLVFQSKYPYGVFLVGGSLAFGFLFRFSEVKEFFKTYFENITGGNGLKSVFTRKENFRIYLIIILGIVYVILSKKGMAPGKTQNYLKYFILLLSVWEILLFLIKFRDVLGKISPSISFILKWAFLPMLFWVLLNPDRVGGITDAATFVKSEGQMKDVIVEKNFKYYFDFFLIYFSESFTSIFLIALVFISIPLSLLTGLTDRFRHNKIEKHFVFSFVFFFTVFVLVFLTPNHQARHFFHMYPAMILGLILLLLSLESAISKIGVIALVLGISIYAAPPVIKKDIKTLDSIELCYMGYNPKEYDLPRWIEVNARNLFKSDSVLINKMEPTHVNKTDTEVLLKMLAYQNKLKLLINPKKLDKIPINFQTAFLISNHCELSSEDNTETTLSVLNWNLSAVVKGDSQGCIKQYARSISP